MMSTLEKLAREYAKKWGITVEDMQSFLQIQRDSPFKCGRLATLGSKILGIKITPRQVRYLIKKYRFILRVGEENADKKTKEFNKMF